MCNILHQRIVQNENNRFFADWIKTISYNETRYGRIPLPLYIRQVTKAPELIDRIFPQEIMDTAHTNPEFFNGRAILAVHHEIVREINAIIIRRMPGEIKVQLAVDRIIHYEDGSDPDKDIGREMINMLNPKSLPPAELELRLY